MSLYTTFTLQSLKCSSDRIAGVLYEILKTFWSLFWTQCIHVRILITTILKVLFMMLSLQELTHSSA